MEWERDEAKGSTSDSRDAYEELKEAYCKECAAHGRTRGVARRLGLVAVTLFVLLVISILAMLRLFQ